MEYQLTGTEQDYRIVDNLRKHASNFMSTNKTLEVKKTDLIKQVHALTVENDKLNNYFKDSQEKFEQEKKRIAQRCNESERELQQLKEKYKDTSEEASRYRSALGKATDVRWGDNDANDSIQLQKTILELRSALTDFTNLKGKEVNEEEADKLLASHKCATVFSDNNKNGRIVLSAALQRMILEMSFDAITEYLEKPNPNNNNISKNDKLESEINSTMKSLVSLVKDLAETRQGSDNITRITPVKVRQQVYGVLGTRGFCKENHSFVEALSDKIIKNLSRYRQIQSNEQNQFKVATMNLIKEIIHLYFRLNAQESVPLFRDYPKSGAPIQNDIMEGKWGGNDIKNLEVEICFFPLIHVKSNNDNSDKILYRAQVYARQKSLKPRK